MRHSPTAWLTIVLLAGAGCAGNPPPVALHADAEGVEALRGKWQGRYWSEETGRNGSIRFELTAVGDTARGDVVMMPGASRERAGPAFRSEEYGEDEPATGMTAPEFLTIHFVLCREGHVHGTLDPYRDPVTGHPLVTTFEGNVVEDSIGGSYSSYDQTTGDRSAGSWYVLRRR